MNANENCMFTLNEETGKYEISTSANNTEANVSIDNSVGKGILEVEIYSSNFASGKGWNNGFALCSMSGKRQVLYTWVRRNNTLYINNEHKYVATLTNGETYKLRLDTTPYDPSRSVDIYVNDIVHSYSSTINPDAATTLSNIWTTSSDTRIKAIRYKKVTE